MSEKVSFKVLLKGSDGKKYVIEYSDLAEKFGIPSMKREIGWIDSRIGSIWEHIRELEQQIVELHQPEARKTVLAFLEVPLNTRQLNSRIYDCSKGVWRMALYKAQDDLLEEKVVEAISQGKGKPRLWSIKK